MDMMTSEIMAKSILSITVSENTIQANRWVTDYIKKKNIYN